MFSNLKEMSLCKVCDLIFFKKEVFNAHLYTHRESDQNITSENHTEVKVKLKNDRNQIDFQCHVCEAKFGRKNKMNAHIASVHEEKRIHHCEICFLSTPFEIGLEIKKMF